MHTGAGKTTLVDRILTAQHGYRVAVILNEIGDEKGIEKALLQDESGALIQLATCLKLLCPAAPSC